MTWMPATPDYYDAEEECWRLKEEVARLTAQRDRLRREIQLLAGELMDGVERTEEPLQPGDMTD